MTSQNQESEAAPELSFVTWTDPKENAFRLEVPTSWTVEGGTFRVAATHANQTVQVQSPDQSMTVRLGDANLPLFLVPTPITRQTYFYAQEGVPFSPNGTFLVMLLPYLPSPTFNRWYLEQALRSVVVNLTITLEEPLQQLARQQTEAINSSLGGQFQVEVTVATTEFRGTSRQTGKPVTGVLASVVHLSVSPQFPGSATWTVERLILSGCTEDGEAEGRHTLLHTVVERMLASWQENPQWREWLNQQMAQGTQQVAQNTQCAIQQSQQTSQVAMKAAEERSRSIAANSEARRQSIMSNYWNRVGVRKEQQRQFVNYLGNTTDVVNPATGQAFQVGSGYNYYYHDTHTDTIIGTNSTAQPPVDFTPLKEW